MLLLEPDFGSAVVLAATTFGVLLLAGARLGHLGVLAAVGGTAFALLIVFQPYRLARLGTFRDPWADEYGAGYQLTQALIAFGRGEWFGLGLGDSVQKLFYLPEAHNDFLFAVIAEETGMVGATIVIALLLAIAVRMLMLGRRAELRGHRFGAYVAYGIGCLVGTQTLINVGVNTGLLPTKGLTLPFVSYGSNSLIASGVLIGLVLRVHWELTWPPERTHRVR
jgi:cell division protein FtsW